MKIIKRGPDDKRMHLVVFITYTLLLFAFLAWMIMQSTKPFPDYNELISITGIIEEKHYNIREHTLYVTLDNNQKIAFSYLSEKKSLVKKLNEGMKVNIKVDSDKGKILSGFEVAQKNKVLYSFEDYKASKKSDLIYAPIILILFLTIWFFCILLPGLGYKAVFDENVPDELKKKDNEAINRNKQ